MVPTGAGSDRTARRLRPRGLLLLVVVLGGIAAVVAWQDEAQGALAVTAALAVAVVVDLVCVLRSLGSPQVEIRLAGEAVVGKPTTLHLSLTGAPHRLWVRLGWWGPHWFTLEPGPAVQLSVVAHIRGILEWIDVDLVARSPLAMWSYGTRVRHELIRPVAVGPAPVPHKVDEPHLRAVHLGDSVVTWEADDLTRGVRDYVPGDPPKLIHWKATARHGDLLVRETETLGAVMVRVVVELDGWSAASDVTAGRAAWLVREYWARGWRVELVTRAPDGSFTRPELGASPFSELPTCALLCQPWMPARAWPVRQAPAVGPLPPVRTVVREVRDPVELNRRLAIAAPGPVVVGTDRRLATRWVTTQGDRWS